MSFLSRLFNSRRNAMQQLAFELDMDFQSKDEYGMISMLKDFRLFRRGHSGKIRNILIKKDNLLDADVRIFDYRFVTGGGNSTRIHKRTVFFMNARHLALPEFWMKPEHFFHRIQEYFGMQDIDFEEFPEFSDQYLLQGDEELVRDMVNEDFLHFFTIEKDWCLEGINYYLIFYRKKRRLPPEQIADFYQKGLMISDMLADDPDETV